MGGLLPQLALRAAPARVESASIRIRMLGALSHTDWLLVLTDIQHYVRLEKPCWPRGVSGPKSQAFPVRNISNNIPRRSIDRPDCSCMGALAAVLATVQPQWWICSPASIHFTTKVCEFARTEISTDETTYFWCSMTCLPLPQRNV